MVLWATVMIMTRLLALTPPAPHPEPDQSAA
jgi:hypothetical protein